MMRAGKSDPVLPIVTPCTLVLGDGLVINVGETEVDPVGDTVTVGETVTLGVTDGDGLPVGVPDGDGLPVTVGETLGDGDVLWQFTQNTLCFTSAPCAPGAWIVSFTCQPCCGCGATPEFCRKLVRSISRSAFGFVLGSSGMLPLIAPSRVGGCSANSYVAVVARGKKKNCKKNWQPG